MELELAVTLEASEASVHSLRLRKMRYLDLKTHNCNLHGPVQLAEGTVGDQMSGVFVLKKIHLVGKVVAGAELDEGLRILYQYDVVKRMVTVDSSPLVLRPPAPLPGSSMSIFSSLGVLASSPPLSLSPLAMLDLGG